MEKLTIEVAIVTSTNIDMNRAIGEDVGSSSVSQTISLYSWSLLRLNALFSPLAAENDGLPGRLMGTDNTFCRTTSHTRNSYTVHKWTSYKRSCTRVFEHVSRNRLSRKDGVRLQTLGCSAHDAGETLDRMYHVRL